MVKMDLRYFLVILVLNQNRFAVAQEDVNESVTSRKGVTVRDESDMTIDTSTLTSKILLTVNGSSFQPHNSSGDGSTDIRNLNATKFQYRNINISGDDVNHQHQDRVPSTVVLNEPSVSSTLSSNMQVNRKNNSVTEMPNEETFVLDKWRKLVTQTSEGLDSSLRKVLPTFLKISSEATLSVECQASFLDMVISLRSMKEWAFRMLDSSGKIPSGILRGTLAEFGDFDECLDIRVPDSTEENFRGQYCLAIIKPQLPKKSRLDFSTFTNKNSVFRSFQSRVKLMDMMAYHLGICIPSTCTNKDIESVLVTALKSLPLTVEVPNCEIRSQIQLDWIQIVIFVSFGFLLLAISFATAVDVLVKAPKHPSSFYMSLKHFSAYSNIKKLFKTKSKKKTFKAINGIKCISIAWIVLDHCFVYANRFNFSRSLNFLENVEDPFYATIWNSWAVVDTFFVIGILVATPSWFGSGISEFLILDLYNPYRGFLLACLTLKYMDNHKGKVNWFGYYIRRIWRLLPSVLFALAFVMILPLLGSGPMWQDIVQREVDVCKRNWWSVLFFLNSWLDYFDMCMVHTWFISNDFHFYVISPVFLILIYKRPKFGFLAVCSVILTSIITLASLTFIYDLTTVIPKSYQETQKLKDLLEMTYFKPYAHLVPYFVGFLLGFFVNRYEKVEVRKLWVVLGWLSSAAFSLTSLYSIADWGKDVHVPLLGSVAYHGLYRLSWSLAIAWLLFACHYGYAGFVNTVLSWSGFIPINRLVYMIYLTHMPIIWLRMGSKKHVVPLEHTEVIYEFLGTSVITLVFSGLAYLVVEAPFASLDAVLFAKVAAARIEKTNSKKDTSPQVQSLDIVIVEGSRNQASESGIMPIIRKKSKDLTGAFTKTLFLEHEAEDRTKRLLELRKMYKEWKPSSSFM